MPTHQVDQSEEPYLGYQYTNCHQVHDKAERVGTLISAVIKAVSLEPRLQDIALEYLWPVLI